MFYTSYSETKGHIMRTHTKTQTTTEKKSLGLFKALLIAVPLVVLYSVLATTFFG